jgi:hypothetical protein
VRVLRPGSGPRAWDPTAPIEELKKLLEEDFEVLLSTDSDINKNQKHLT